MGVEPLAFSFIEKVMSGGGASRFLLFEKVKSGSVAHLAFSFIERVKNGSGASRFILF